MVVPFAINKNRDVGVTKRDWAVPSLAPAGSRPIGAVIPPESIRILQCNLGGSRTKHLELMKFLEDHAIDICCIQETKLCSGDNYSLRGYNVVRQDNPISSKLARVGGLMFLIKIGVAFEVVKDSASSSVRDLEISKIEVFLKRRPLVISNIYRPPDPFAARSHAREEEGGVEFEQLLDTPSLPSWEQDSLGGVCKDALVLGDFNLHHNAWRPACLGAVPNDASALWGWTRNSKMRLVSNSEATHNKGHAIDLSFTSLPTQTVEWSTQGVIGKADHYPIIIEITKEKPTTNIRESGPRWLMEKADWANFFHYAEIEFKKIADANPDALSISQLNDKIVEIFISKAAKNIPKTSYEKPHKTPLPKEAVKKSKLEIK